MQARQQGWLKNPITLSASLFPGVPVDCSCWSLQLTRASGPSCPHFPGCHQRHPVEDRKWILLSPDTVACYNIMLVFSFKNHSPVWCSMGSVSDACDLWLLSRCVKQNTLSTAMALPISQRSSFHLTFTLAFTKLSQGKKQAPAHLQVRPSVNSEI